MRDPDPWENDPQWTPHWDPERLMVAIPLQQMNKRGIPGIERLNVLMDDAFKMQLQPFLYPVWLDGNQMYFHGIAVAEPEWLEDADADGQLAYFQEQGEDGWIIDWHGAGVLEFPFQRVNDCLYQFYQREMDQENEACIPDGLREYPLAFHVVRRDDHDARYPVGLLITASHSDGLTPSVVRALYGQLIQEKP